MKRLYTALEWRGEDGSRGVRSHPDSRLEPYFALLPNAAKPYRGQAAAQHPGVEQGGGPPAAGAGRHAATGQHGGAQHGDTHHCGRDDAVGGHLPLVPPGGEARRQAVREGQATQGSLLSSDSMIGSLLSSDSMTGSLLSSDSMIGSLLPSDSMIGSLLPSGPSSSTRLPGG
eukprot:6642250-Pyramimonas_sp.AAC.1